MRNFALFCVGVMACAFAARGETRTRLMDGWRFARTETDGIAFPDVTNALNGAVGANVSAFACNLPKESQWASVRVPHDWAVDEPFSLKNPAFDAFLNPHGIGWYRRSLDLAAADSGKRVFVDFDGAMSYAMVWLNGHFVGGWPYGYASFRVELTPFVRFGGKNELFVRLDNPQDSSRWYTGAGLYRNVYLVTADPIHIDYHGLYITTPAVSPETATVRVVASIRNDSTAAVNARVSCAAGPNVSTECVLAPGLTVVTNTLTLVKPKLWAIESPSLYTLAVTVADVSGAVRDNAVTRFGVRTIAFYPDGRAFLLNGKTVHIKGVCLHHDLGVLGAAFNVSATRRRLALLKEAGVNALRMSHNQPAPELLDLCDEMGFLVKDEIFDQWNYPKHSRDYSTLFPLWAERDIRAWMRADRNHPSVIMWSLGNEIEDSFKNMPLYIETGKRLAAIAHSEDATRPVTEANNNAKSGFSGFQSTCDVFGYNYQGLSYAKFRAANPSIPLFGSETVCTSSSRGEYFFPVTKEWLSDVWDYHFSSYDWMANDYRSGKRSWACPPDDEWRDQEQNPSVMGEFIWSGIDYLGGPYITDQLRKHPRFIDPAAQSNALSEVKTNGLARSGIHSCACGLLDLAGFPKDRFFLYQSHWRPDFPMAHILPHWNWPERVGQATPVYVYTSGDEAELFLNGVSQGRLRKAPSVYRLMWNDVIYQPGTLRVIAYKNGKKWAEDSVTTTGPVAAIKLTPEYGSLVSDGESIQFVTLTVVDAQSRVVPRSRTRVQLRLSGPGEIVGSDNGDETDFDGFRSDSRRVFNGSLSILLRARPSASGHLELRATSPTLPIAELRLPVRRP